jgi:hypothetical protein
MKECVFWDSEDSKFINWEEVSFTKDKGDDFVILIKEIDHIYSSARLYDSFDYIGLNDINNNKIYADSSIVEFTASGSHGYTQLKGYFHFLKEDLKYIIKTFTHGSFDFNKQLYKNFKIIDTIQENKLGLIKE